MYSVVKRRATGGGESARRKRAQRKTASVEDDEIHVPSIVSTVGNRGLDVLQKLFYERFLDTHIEGRNRTFPSTPTLSSPPTTRSHLDMGLVKMALGEHGRDMVALAAADYFFDNKYKRA